MSTPQVKATLTLDLTYEGPDATPEYIKGQLEHLIKTATGTGLLVGAGDLVVESYSHTIVVGVFGEETKS